MTARALVLHAQDNVATLLGEAGAGADCPLKGALAGTVTLLEDIPYGHKIAVKPIAEGEVIRKYGEPIGTANAAIATGALVHVHNVESHRGRGDLRSGAEGAP